MEATSVSVEKIEKHWPKFGYALSATALTLIVTFSDKKEIFSKHRLTAIGLGATVVLGVVFGRAIEYDGWRSFSLFQQGIVIVSGFIGVFSVFNALSFFSPEIRVGIALAGLLFISFALNGPRTKVTSSGTKKNA